MQETHYQTADAEDTLSASGCRSPYIRQQMQETLYQTAGTGDTLSDSGIRSLPIRQRMQETFYLTPDAGDSCIRCLIECLLHPLSERETTASAV